jgi:hypothetical protein
MIGTLLECRVCDKASVFVVQLGVDWFCFQFYLADLEDELTVAALRMLVMDLLILFQAGNEGVINVLGNFRRLIATFTLTI